MKKQISGLALLVASSLAISCGSDNPVSDVAGGLCKGFECKSIATAGGSITGIAEFDAFFTSVVNFNAQANILDADVKATLAELAAAAGAEVGANADATATNIAAEVMGGFGGNIEGGITIQYAPPRCEVSAEASIQAAAKCDATVKPGMASIKCEGTCEAEASAMVECSGSAELKCTGTAPSFACEGTCQGSCDVSAGASCEGECKGTCELDGTAACDGECAGTEEGGMCTGECKLRAGAKCEGTCKGTCELHAGGTCSGECKGECTYTPPEGGCTGGAKASCTASANASVECKGECKGEATPPEVKAECEASVKAEADFNAECTPPTLDVAYKLSAEFEANGSADAKAEFAARIEAFGKAYGKLVAKGAKLKLVGDAGAGILAAAGVAITDGLGAVANSNASFIVKAQALCAVDELGTAKAMISSAASKVSGNVTAVGKVTGAVGG
jgi:hypothetical protein